MKRFYKNAEVQAVDGGWQIMLDGRGIKTVKGAPQTLPSEVLAQVMAEEWASQGEELDPRSLPMRDMADYAIDLVSENPSAVANKLIGYGETDTLCYRADPDEALYARQQDAWEPLLAAFEQREGVEMVRVSGVLHRPQHEATLSKLRERLRCENTFVLAGLEAMTSLAASLVIGLSAVRPDSDAEALWDAASLEEDWQAELWGRDAEAEERRAKRRADFLKACEFTRLAAHHP